MSALAAAAIGGLAISAYGVAEGAKQKSAGAKLAAQNQFTPETMPYEVGQATQLAKQNYTNGMPGMSYAKNAIAQNSATSLAAATKGASSGGDIIDAANKEQVSANNATNQLALQAASYKSNALGGYEAALGNQAGWQDKLYQNNTLQPYLRTANTAASLQGAGEQNIYSSLNSADESLVAGAKGISDNQKAKAAAANGQLNTNQILALSSLLSGA